MANYSLADVKVLRDRLGAGMLDSKNALVEADGDLDKAIEILRVKGLKGVAKREGRTTTAGLVTAKPGTAGTASPSSATIASGRAGACRTAASLCPLNAERLPRPQ